MSLTDCNAEIIYNLYVTGSKTGYSKSQKHQTKAIENT